MGERRGSSLAARLRAGIDQKIAEQRRIEDERRRKLEAAQALRKALLDDLRAFGEEVGHFTVTVPTRSSSLWKSAEPLPPGSLCLVYGEQSLEFLPHGELMDVAVAGTNIPEGTVIQREETLQRWVLRWRRRGNRESVMLFDQGLETLLRTAFEVAPAEALPAEATDAAAESTARSQRTL